MVTSIACAVDENGQVIWGDLLTLLFARAVLKSAQVRRLLAVKCSKLLYDGIAEAGGRPVMWKAGQPHQSQMKETGAALAGEMSGHIFLLIDSMVLTMRSTSRSTPRTPRTRSAPSLSASIWASTAPLNPEIRRDCQSEDQVCARRSGYPSLQRAVPS